MSLAFWRGRLAAAAGKPPRAAISDPGSDSGFWDRLNEATRRVLAAHLRPGESVLDAGCGCGDLFGLVPEGVTYVGIDLVPEFVEDARARFPRGTFEVADLADLSRFADGRFDWAVCRGVAADVLKPALPGLRRACRAVLVISFSETPAVEVFCT